MNEIVRLPIHNGSFVEILGERRRIEHTNKPGCRPRIWTGDLAVTHGPSQINHWQEIAEREDRSACCGHNVQHLKLRRVIVIPARHAEATEDELREERQ